MFFLGLPLIIISVVFFLGLGLGNAGLLFLSMGHMLLVPAVVLACHFITGFLPSRFINLNVPYSDIGQLVPSIPVSAFTTETNVYPSYWMAHFTFFCSYILFNAAEVYNLPPISDSDDYLAKVQARTSRAMVIMIFTIAIFAALAFIRLRYTNTEHIFGVLFSTAIFGVFGYAWLKASSELGIRTMDIFGVAQQMLLVQDPSIPTTCVNQA
jgi:hypothetical protein